jgi:TonB family protein
MATVRAISAQESMSPSIADQHLVEHAPPAYPPLAIAARVQGAVVLDLTIGKDGSVEDLKVVSGHPLLVKNAIEAVKRWTYKPFVIKGEPVEVSIRLEVNFLLTESRPSVKVSTESVAELVNSVNSASLAARLSYHRVSAVWIPHQGHSWVCFALYRSGRYRVLKDTEKGTEFFEGELSPSQLSTVIRMLAGLDFQTSAGAGIVRQGSETFKAEVHVAGETQRYVWLDPDHQRPFPKSAKVVVDWLRDFRAEGASPLTLGEFSVQEVCP